jgi:hypothetical protein
MSSSDTNQNVSDKPCTPEGRDRLCSHQDMLEAAALVKKTLGRPVGSSNADVSNSSSSGQTSNSGRGGVASQLQVMSLSSSSSGLEQAGAFSSGSDGVGAKSATAAVADAPRKEKARVERMCGWEGCGRVSFGLKLCSSCRSVWYCGPECSKKAWPTHKVQCKAAASRKQG